ncbi:AAA family ATPase [Streptococcus caecimuris]|uniref:AAA family ATPase n=1 Tax=Streptococcus caecimuris TaxID=2941338 RepID=UPI00203A9D74|nr:ATP-binding protein [Streptococcus caecimuris]
MLKYFSVKNYKNFENEISIDFSQVGGYKFNEDCLSNNILSKVLIYGRNATGKSNLGLALFDITKNLSSRSLIDDQNLTSFLNNNSDNAIATFCYIFLHNNNEIKYIYTKNEYQIIQTESLSINNELVWEIDLSTDLMSPTPVEGIANKLGIINNDFNILIDNYRDQVSSDKQDLDGESRSFLTWLITNTSKSDASILTYLRTFIRNMVLINHEAPKYFINRWFQRTLDHKETAKELEAFLNSMGINCHLDSIEQIDGEDMLCFVYKNKNVPFFREASSGTLALAKFYFRILYIIEHFKANNPPKFLFFDEFDAFYHYELSEKLICHLKKIFPDTQIILTTHDTNIMSNELFRPDCLFILSQKGFITPLNKATKRELREGHNLEKMYISGEFAEYE